MRTSERDSRHEEIYTGNEGTKSLRSVGAFFGGAVPHVIVIEWWNLRLTEHLTPSRSRSHRLFMPEQVSNNHEHKSNQSLSQLHPNFRSLALALNSQPISY